MQSVSDWNSNEVFPQRGPVAFVFLGLRPSADSWVDWVTLGEIG
jgi:hypothetical protein